MNYWSAGMSDEEVSIAMDNAAQEEYAIEEESEDPHFAMSVCY